MESAPGDPRGDRKFLILLLLISAALRIGFSGFGREYIEATSRTSLKDSLDYRTMGRQLAAGGGFDTRPLNLNPRPPLYPLMLAGVYLACGDGYWPVRVAQALLDLGSLALVFFFARGLFDGRVARVAGALVCLNPFFLFYSGFELTETLTVFLTLGCAACVRRWEVAGGSGRALACGVAFGLGNLCRPTLGIAGALLLGAALLARRCERRACAAAALAFAGFWVVVAPWAWHNLELYGKFASGPVGIGQGLYAANNPKSVTGTGILGVDFDLDPEVENLPDMERDRIYLQRALDYIRAEPGIYVGRVFFRLYRLWQPIPWAPEFSGSWKTALALAGEGIFLPFFAVGLWLTRRRWRELLFPYALVFSLSAVHGLIVSGMRYRLPAMPFALVLAAYALVFCADRWLWRPQ